MTWISPGRLSGAPVAQDVPAACHSQEPFLTRVRVRRGPAEGLVCITFLGSQPGNAASTRNTASLRGQEERGPGAPGSDSQTSLRREYLSSAHILLTKEVPRHTQSQDSTGHLILPSGGTCVWMDKETIVSPVFIPSAPLGEAQPAGHRDPWVCPTCVLLFSLGN